ncbi:hypothetical protein AVEN_225876-1 [Araneus ventricosus]|uniref:Uncharacterized protein n=1 Tax=Araneus ventricosus TaxID=182803 RepID=A0A4Y2BE03_ARAVE|nr:hypothetical protein AVEN_225876-1 [Araneus ventricosus]
MMGKAAILSKFDRGQIVMALRLGTSITETARMVGCSRFAVVSIHAKWINDSDTSSRRQGVGHPRVIKEKGRQRLSRLVKQNRCQTVAQLTAQYNAGPILAFPLSVHDFSIDLLCNPTGVRSHMCRIRERFFAQLPKFHETFQCKNFPTPGIWGPV